MYVLINAIVVFSVNSQALRHVHTHVVIRKQVKWRKLKNETDIIMCNWIQNAYAY